VNAGPTRANNKICIHHAFWGLAAVVRSLSRGAVLQIGLVLCHYYTLVNYLQKRLDTGWTRRGGGGSGDRGKDMRKGKTPGESNIQK